MSDDNDIFNLTTSNNNIIEMIKELCILAASCRIYIDDINEEQGEEIVATIERLEKQFMSLKEGLVQMLYLLDKNFKKE